MYIGITEIVFILFLILFISGKGKYIINIVKKIFKK